MNNIKRNELTLFFLLWSTFLADASLCAIHELKDINKDLKDQNLIQQDQGINSETSISDWIPKRRGEQAKTSKGHIITPAVANIPGLGFFYGVIGGAFNLFQTESDLFIYRFWGQITGEGFGIVEIPVIGNRFTLNFFHNKYTKANIGVYRRTVRSSEKDVVNKVLSNYQVILGQANYRLLDRRVQLNIGLNSQRETLDGYHDFNGIKFSPHQESIGPLYNLSYGIIVDLSDDKSDPRKGLIVEAFRYDRPNRGKFHPYYYNLDYNLLYHVPIGESHTWVINYYRSDSIVRSRGMTDPITIKDQLNLQCDSFSSLLEVEKCRYYEQNMVEDKVMENKYGTAIPIGGTQRLQAYSTNRFLGAFTQTVGTEFRLNLTQEFSPFNIGILSGIRTGIQFAGFYEKGVAVEKQSELLNFSLYKPSYGGGVRFLLASGFVIRMDVAFGDEGYQPIIIFQYPWNVF